MKASEPSDAR